MRRIPVELTRASIQNAIDEVTRLRDSLPEIATLIRMEFADRVAQKAQSGFDASEYDYYTDGSTETAHIDVSVADDGETTTVSASGEEVIFIEFGAGVRFNGPVGGSPHPDGAKLGFTIGGFGKGFGRFNVWHFSRAKPGTMGTPAQMPLYKATQETIGELKEIAEEVLAAW